MTTPETLRHLLIVDDDERLRSLLARYLGRQGWLVTCARDIPDAEVKLRFFIFDAIILDLMMPGESGLDFARRFVPVHDTPILMLTAMGESDDRIVGLESGAEDYLSKPFEPRELELRLIRMLGRQRPATAEPASPQLRFGAFTLDIQQRRLLHEGEPLHLTESEMSLLCALADFADQSVSREQLNEAISKPGEDSNPRSTDVLVTRLRRKIEPDPARPVYLQTVRGAGYVLRR
jgi:two-component system phosphate regulon response regulator OmpR